MAITWLDPFLLAVTDAVYAAIPRRCPPPGVLEQARIYSHRGERDDVIVLEDTFEAYDELRGSGVCGLECDVRFTRDLQPVVFHDPDLFRLYNDRERIADLDLETLQQRYPRIPTLRALVERYGGDFELMIEFKAEPRPDPELQLRRIAEALAPLTPCRDYHLMSLDIDTLDWLAPLEGNPRVPIARSNVRIMGDYAVRQRCPAFTGHYVLLRGGEIARHVADGRTVGVGFPNSRNALRFALNQGSRWIFTNAAVRMQRELDRWRESCREAR